MPKPCQPFQDISKHLICKKMAGNFAGTKVSFVNSIFNKKM